jgi:hypothetical protein
VGRVDVVIPESSELGIQPPPFVMSDNPTIFVFKERQNSCFSVCSTIIFIGTVIAITGMISIVNLDYSKLSGIILLPLPVFYIQ